MYKPQGAMIANPFAAPIGRNVSGGKTFFVTTSGRGGSDDHEGTDPEFPLLKLDAALELCTDRKNDFIFVQDYYDQDSFPITVDKRNVHIIGLDGGSFYSSRIHCNGGGEATGCFEIGGSAGGGLELAGFTFYNDGAPGITAASAAAVFTHIHHCSFGIVSAIQDGIFFESVAQEFGWGLVDSCIFGNNITRDGIRIHNVTRSYFMDCIFRGVAGIGIHIGSAGGMLGGILDNRFYQKIAPDKGFAITLDHCYGGIITGNEAVEDGGHAGSNPYLDTSTGTDTTTKNGWGINYKGTEATYPAFSV